MNETKPLWTRNPKDIEEEEYVNFYKSFTKDFSGPMKYSHFIAEGEVEFKSLLFIPEKAPYNMFDPNTDSQKGIKLYVKRVFITDEFKDILPKYLAFIKGLVDSDDLPLNVSREMLQEHKILKLIKKKLVRKVIAMIQEMAEGKKKTNEEGVEETDYSEFHKFWEQYGTNIKLGVIEDVPNRTRLSKLLLFYSSQTGKLSTFSDYVSRMKEGQKQIYYLAGETKEAVETSPLLEKLQNKGYEVLYMIDPIDEYCMANLEKFDGKFKLTNIGKEGLTLDGEEKDEEKEKETKEKFSKLTDFLKKTLADKIDKAIITDRLTSSPSALVSSAYGWTANMERIIKAQALGGDTRAQQMYQPKKIMEINPNHPLIQELLRRVEENEQDPTANDIAELMFDTASLSSGYSLDNPNEFASRIVKMMALGLNVQLGSNPSTQEKHDEL